MYDASRILLNLVRSPFVEGTDPNFLIPGAGRSGTSSLVYYLREHPETYLAPVKEVQFFNAFYWKGEDWYRQQFQAPPSARAVGESSVRYLDDEEAARRIWEFNPEMKLVFMFRNPVHRAYSQYKREIQTHGRTESFAEVVDIDPRFRRRGRYFTHLSRFLEHFPRDQIRIFLADQFFGQTQQVLREVCEFIGVDPDYEFERPKNTVQNQSTVPKSRLAQKCIYKMFGQRDGESVPARYLRGGARVLLSRLNVGSNKGFPPPDDETLEELRDFYDDEVARLDDLVDFDLGEYWDFPSLA